MADIGAQLNQLTPEQRQAVMMQAQQEANQSILQELMKEMVATCFEKCSGTSVRCTLSLLGPITWHSRIFRRSSVSNFPVNVVHLLGR